MGFLENTLTVKRQLAEKGGLDVDCILNFISISFFEGGKDKGEEDEEDEDEGKENENSGRFNLIA